MKFAGKNIIGAALALMQNQVDGLNPGRAPGLLRSRTTRGVKYRAPLRRRANVNKGGETPVYL